MEKRKLVERGNLQQKRIGEILLKARTKAGLSRKDLAKEAELSGVTIWQIEVEKVIPRLYTLREIVQVLPITLEEVLNIPEKSQNIGEAILYERTRAGLTREELVEKSGISIVTISNIETGKVIPQMNTLRKIVKVLPITLEELLGKLDCIPGEPQNVGEAILYARIKVGLSQQELAKKSGLSTVTISNIENEKTIPRMSILGKLVQVLPITLEELLGKLHCIPGEPQNIGEAILYARIKVGLSQQELAKKSGLSTVTISNIENGKVTPYMNTLIKLVQVLPTINLEELLSFL